MHAPCRVQMLQWGVAERGTGPPSTVFTPRGSSKCTLQSARECSGQSECDRYQVAVQRIPKWVLPGMGSARNGAAWQPTITRNARVWLSWRSRHVMMHQTWLEAQSACVTVGAQRMAPRWQEPMIVTAGVLLAIAPVHSLDQAPFTGDR